MTAKKIYEIGEIPQMGEVPEEMYAWVIREDRLGVPEMAMHIEKMPVQKQCKHSRPCQQMNTTRCLIKNIRSKAGLVNK